MPETITPTPDPAPTTPTIEPPNPCYHVTNIPYIGTPSLDLNIAAVDPFLGLVNNITHRPSSGCRPYRYPPTLSPTPPPRLPDGTYGNIRCPRCGSPHSDLLDGVYQAPVWWMDFGPDSTRVLNCGWICGTCATVCPPKKDRVTGHRYVPCGGTPLSTVKVFSPFVPYSQGPVDEACLLFNRDQLSQYNRRYHWLVMPPSHRPHESPCSCSACQHYQIYLTNRSRDNMPIIASYHHTPRPWDARPASINLHAIGVELEILCKRNAVDLGAVASAARALNFIAERDGSLDREWGVEIIGPPLLLSNYQNLSDGLWPRFLKAIQGRCIGWDAGPGYGMHVSINKLCANNRAQAAMRCLVHNHPETMSILANRPANTSCVSFRKKEMPPNPAPHPQDRHEALSFANTYRGEFRIFRSTLRLSSFRKNVEVVASIRDFCLETYDSNPLTWMDWVIGHAAQYPQLNKWFGKPRKSNVPAIEELRLAAKAELDPNAITISLPDPTPTPAPTAGSAPRNPPLPVAEPVPPRPTGWREMIAAFDRGSGVQQPRPIQPVTWTAETTVYVDTTGQ